MKWIQERHSMLHGYERVSPYYEGGYPIPSRTWVVRRRDAPWNLRIFGEKPVESFCLGGEISSMERERFESLFPEAEVSLPPPPH